MLLGLAVIETDMCGSKASEADVRTATQNNVSQRQRERERELPELVISGTGCYWD